MPDEPIQENNKHFSITFSLDRGDYFRRACPSCGRHFKTKAGASDLAAAFQPAFQQQGIEIGLASTSTGDAGVEQAETYVYCPYCGDKAKTSDTLTSVFSEYAKRYVMREVVLPQLNKTFSDLEDSFRGSGSSSGGFLSIKVKFEQHKEVLPPRPISGPEPPDMLVVELLCCGKHAKIIDGWHGLMTCPYCGNTCQLQ